MKRKCRFNLLLLNFGSIFLVHYWSFYNFFVFVNNFSIGRKRSNFIESFQFLARFSQKNSKFLLSLLNFAKKIWFLIFYSVTFSFLTTKLRQKFRFGFETKLRLLTFDVHWFESEILKFFNPLSRLSKKWATKRSIFRMTKQKMLLFKLKVILLFLSIKLL